MPPPGRDGHALPPILTQLSAHAERIGGLDAREATHHQHHTAGLQNLPPQMTAVSPRISEINAALARQSAILDSLDGLATQVAAIATQVATLALDDRSGADSGRYQPVPSPRWWKLNGTEQDAAADRLRGWSEPIYRPSYGRLADLLPPYWEYHPACLFTPALLTEL